MKTAKLVPALLATLLALPVFAQTATEAQRNVDQQQRIENGLKSGQLTTREASKLEREESNINRAEANAMKDGVMTSAEQKRINSMQNRASQDIYNQKHDAQVGNSNSASSQRMQADVQRNVNQEKRIQNGIANGSLSSSEAAKLDRGQAKVDRQEARDGRDGNVSAREQRRIQHAENRQSGRIHRLKTD